MRIAQRWLTVFSDVLESNATLKKVNNSQIRYLFFMTKYQSKDKNPPRSPHPTDQPAQNETPFDEPNAYFMGRKQIMKIYCFHMGVCG